MLSFCYYVMTLILGILFKDLSLCRAIQMYQQGAKYQKELELSRYHSNTHSTQSGVTDAIKLPRLLARSGNACECGAF